MTQQNDQIEGLTQQEALQILERDLATAHVVNEMICAFCNEVDETLDHVYCETCRLNPSITGNRMLYYCSDCKRTARKKHFGRYNHQVNWRLVQRLNENTLILAQISSNHSKKHNVMTQKSENERSIKQYNKDRYLLQTESSILTGSLQALAMGSKEITTMANIMSKSMIEICKETGKRGLSVNSIKSLGKSLKQAGIIGKHARHWLKAGPIQLALCALEVGKLFYDYSTGTIPNVKELVRRTGCVVLRNTAAWAGGYVGWNIGAIIGCIGGPVGAIIGGVIGAVLGGMGADKLVGWIFNKLFPPSDETIRQKALEAAVKYFRLNPKHITDPNKFNEEKIRSLYKKLAKIYHPDVQDTGDHEEFIKLSEHYATLLSVVNARNNKIVKKTIKAVAS